MEAVGRMSGALSAQGGLEAKLSSVGAIRAEMSRGSPAAPEYDGAYIVVPDTSSQRLPTQGLRMRRDVTVEGIPYAEVSNESGGLTATIAS